MTGIRCSIPIATAFMRGHRTSYRTPERTTPPEEERLNRMDEVETNQNQSTTMRRVQTTLDDGTAEIRCNCGKNCKNARCLKIHKTDKVRVRSRGWTKVAHSELVRRKRSHASLDTHHIAIYRKLSASEPSLDRISDLADNGGPQDIHSHKK